MADPEAGFGIRIQYGERGDPAGDLQDARAFHDHFPEVEMTRSVYEDRVQFDCPRCGMWLAAPLRAD